MIKLSIHGDNFDSLIRKVETMARPDLTGLAPELRTIMLEDNRDGLLAGLNANGDVAEPVTPETIRRGRGGDGPPRVPRGSASRAISTYDVAIEQDTPERLLLIGTWGVPWIHFHDTGTIHMVAREMVGIRPEGQRRIAEALEAFAGRLVGEF